MAIDGQEGGVEALLESLLEETESRMVEYHARSALQYHIAEQDGMLLGQERPSRLKNS